MKRKRVQAGFSLLELLIAMALLMVVMGTLLTAAAKLQQRYRGEQLMTEVTQGSRAMVELMHQELFMAGHHGFRTRYIDAPLGVVGSIVPQAVMLNDTANMFIGQKVLVGAGPGEEVVTVTDIVAGAIVAAFRRDHAHRSPVSAVSGFPTGILDTSTGTSLQFYGDLDSDGTLEYVEYNVTNTGELTRSLTPAGAGVKNAASVMLTNLQPNPDGSEVFRYVARARSGRTFITQVNITLTQQTADRDPESGQFRNQTVTATVLPRNIQAAYGIANASSTYLQNEPPGVPVP